MVISRITFDLLIPCFQFPYYLSSECHSCYPHQSAAKPLLWQPIRVCYCFTAKAWWRILNVIQRMTLISALLKSRENGQCELVSHHDISSHYYQSCLHIISCFHWYVLYDLLFHLSQIDDDGKRFFLMLPHSQLNSEPSCPKSTVLIV